VQQSVLSVSSALLDSVNDTPFVPVQRWSGLSWRADGMHACGWPRASKLFRQIWTFKVVSIQVKAKLMTDR
jgi:hypothetical protein